MPTATRRQAQPRNQRINEPTTASDGLPSQDADEETIPDPDLMEDDENGVEDDDDIEGTNM